jgi:hypothetical protein
MKKKLKKVKIGRPAAHDFAGLKQGQTIQFSQKAQKNPFPYVAAWNKKNKKKRIEVWRDNEGLAYARLAVVR